MKFLLVPRILRGPLQLVHRAPIRAPRSGYRALQLNPPILLEHLKTPGKKRRAALATRQRFPRGTHPARFRSAQRHGFRGLERAGLRRRAMDFVVVFIFKRPVPVFIETIEACISHYGPEPGLRARSLQVIKKAARAQRRLLHHILAPNSSRVTLREVVRRIQVHEHCCIETNQPGFVLQANAPWESPITLDCAAGGPAA
jgi:hypothetical protein